MTRLLNKLYYEYYPKGSFLAVFNLGIQSFHGRELQGDSPVNEMSSVFFLAGNVVNSEKIWVSPKRFGGDLIMKLKNGLSS